MNIVELEQRLQVINRLAKKWADNDDERAWEEAYAERDKLQEEINTFNSSLVVEFDIYSSRYTIRAED